MIAGTGLTGNELYPRFSGAEYDRRYHAVREAMRQDNLDAILSPAPVAHQRSTICQTISRSPLAGCSSRGKARLRCSSISSTISPAPRLSPL